MRYSDDDGGGPGRLGAHGRRAGEGGLGRHDHGRPPGRGVARSDEDAPPEAVARRLVVRAGHLAGPRAAALDRGADRPGARGALARRRATRRRATTRGRRCPSPTWRQDETDWTAQEETLRARDARRRGRGRRPCTTTTSAVPGSSSDDRARSSRLRRSPARPPLPRPACARATRGPDARQLAAIAQRDAARPRATAADGRSARPDARATCPSRS